MTLAEKLDKVMLNEDPWGYRDAEFSVEQADYNIKNMPEVVIEWLLDVILQHMGEEV